jgi:hypothetical protein
VINVLKDLTGQIFGLLKVIKRAENRNGKTYWICECQCKNKTIKEVRGSHLKSERIRSCGCLYKERERSKVPPNIFDFKDDYKVGYTDTNQEFYYDMGDSQIVETHNWYFDRDGYVVARIDGKGVKLHKLLMNTSSKVDHRNRRRYDNRRNNLRIATKYQNGMNINIRKDNSSGVTGVGWHSREDCWRARITIEGKQINLGNFDNFENAVKARHDAELMYFGEFSPLYNNCKQIII